MGDVMAVVIAEKMVKVARALQVPNPGPTLSPLRDGGTRVMALASCVFLPTSSPKIYVSF